MKIGELSTVTRIPGISSLISSDSSVTSPGQYMDFLTAASSGSVQNLGQETIGGVQTTHYSAQIDLSKLAGVVPAPQLLSKSPPASQTTDLLSLIGGG